MTHGRATLLVAEQDGRLAGYVFAGIEPQSWKELRYEAGFIHDIIVDNRHRQSGIGEALIAGAIEWFTARRVTRVMLWSAYDNTGAQRLFRRAGFRPTMMEMTLDL
jgi:ribosomal protein S18 acetylase RimI-like enzyme